MLKLDYGSQGLYFNRSVVVVKARQIGVQRLTGERSLWLIHRWMRES